MKVFTSLQIKNIEDATVLRGISKLRLMENAGSAAARVIREKFDITSKKTVVVAGCGNNGGDGFVVARKLYENGGNVEVIRLLGLPQSENASEMCKKLMETGVPIHDYFDNVAMSKAILKSADIIVDAVFGIGLNRAPDTSVSEAFSFISSLPAFRVAIDVPSGVYADSARVHTSVIKADLTVSFIGFKFCHILPPASSFCGELVNCAIGVADDVLDYIEGCPETIEPSFVFKRDKNAHKGTFGKALLVTGSYGMAGATVLSLKSALRSGVGLGICALPEKIYPIVAGSVLEAVYIPCPTNVNGGFAANTYFAIKNAIESADCILFGCGVGNTNDTVTLLRDILENAKSPVIIDADGINALSRNIDIIKQSAVKIILTPHPAEMARLCKVGTEEINSNRIYFAKKLAHELGVTVVLKGANTIVATEDEKVFVNMTGNPGMATGGSGDVLAGMMAGLIASGVLHENDAVCAAVYLHGLAGDVAAQKLSETSLLPSDIIDNLPPLFKNLEG